MSVDSHVHFWETRRGDYVWLSSDSPLARDWLPADLAPLAMRARIDGVLLVQAAPTRAETDYLLSLAATSGVPVLGVVGWADLEAKDAESQVDDLASVPGVCGLRAMLTLEADDAWIARPRVIGALRHAGQAGLTIELLAGPRHLLHIGRAIDQAGDPVVVIDHLGKPSPRAWDEGWASAMASLAERPRVACKVSGLVPPALTNDIPGLRTRQVAHVLETFGPARLMIGSDWPVSSQAGEYDRVLATTWEWMGALSEPQREAIGGATARRVFRFQGPES